MTCRATVFSPLNLAVPVRSSNVNLIFANSPKVTILSPFTFTGKLYTSCALSKDDGILTLKAPVSVSTVPAAINWLLFVTTLINSPAVTL